MYKVDKGVEVIRYNLNIHPGILFFYYISKISKLPNFEKHCNCKK